MAIVPIWEKVRRLKDPVTIEDLRGAMRAVYKGKVAHDEGWIKQISEFIMDFFGYEDIVLDNTLTPRDRDIFYILETAGLLKTEMEETTIHKGKTWRIHYWMLNRDRIHELAGRRNGSEAKASPDSESSVYNGLSDKVWTRK